MPRHTPGPWEVQNGAVQTARGSVPIAKMDREVGNGTAPVERDANAHLIAAAPELAEAVWNLLRYLPCKGVNPNLRDRYKRLLEKATGER